MEAAEFEELKRLVAEGLTAAQCLELSGILRRGFNERMSEVLIARSAQMIEMFRRCRHCGHTDIVKHGYDANGRQRFRCRQGVTEDGEVVGCGRTFNGLTNTVLARMRMPEQWMAYATAMEKHVSVKDLAERLGIARLTAWRWRHRLLSVQAVREADKVSGVIEVDETFFRTSYKGSRGWKRGNPPENRPPRYRGGAALAPGLSG